MVMEIDHPVEGKVKSIGFPVKLSRDAAKGQDATAAPRRAHRGGARRTRHRRAQAIDAPPPGRVRGMSEGAVHLKVEGRVASIVFDRPDARNAMTWAMYNQLDGVCERLAANKTWTSRCFAAPAKASLPARTSPSLHPSPAPTTASPTSGGSMRRSRRSSGCRCRRLPSCAGRQWAAA